MKIDINDDLGGAQKPFKVIAVIPVHERLELLPHTIRRLYVKNGVDKVICVGDGLKERSICLIAGADWVPYQNKPLGAKWNAGMLAAKKYNPDAVLYVGSSDWVCSDWLTIMKPYVESHHLTGVPGCYFMDLGPAMRLVKWNGYTGARAGESIGIGRMLSSTLLDKIGWKPFDDKKDSSLDRSMKDKALAVGISEVHVKDPKLEAVSISTHKWQNLHKFEMHWNNLLPSEKITVLTDFLYQFPEANEVFK